MKLFVTAKQSLPLTVVQGVYALANIMLSVITAFVEMPIVFTGTQPKRKAKSSSCIYSPEDP